MQEALIFHGVVALLTVFDPTMHQRAKWTVFVLVLCFHQGGYYAAHLRRTIRKLRESRDALIKGLKQAEGVVFQPLKAPSQGLHLTVFLNNTFKDTLFEHTARNCGFPIRAISRYCENNQLNGILIGYCGFTPDAYEKAGKQLANLALQMTDMT